MSKVKLILLLLLEIILIYSLVFLVGFSVSFINETVSVGSGFIFIVWLVLLVGELPILCGLLALIVLIAVSIYTKLTSSK